MSKVLVIELPDEADIVQALHVIRVNALEHIRGSRVHIRGSRVHAAIKEDADKILSVFEPSSSDPEGPR